ncbi:hypothetical protein QJS10_CPA05g01419 [Acorus calamus]|uniref:Uncharacterized protein n=1 Tax=Acorus calamus TaxID=4465 RepID=A0AAV9EWA7_ACOCL|nr:hypothetical protein QJS10_CPA05g01419 [Acorus calamus]
METMIVAGVSSEVEQTVNLSRLLRKPGTIIAQGGINAEREKRWALSLLAAARNYGDPAVKVSSLRQAGEILSSIDPSSAAELFPYLVDLHSSPETLVRRCLAELLGKLGPRAIQHSLVLMPALSSLLRDDAPVVVKQSIVSGTHFFCTCVGRDDTAGPKLLAVKFLETFVLLFTPEAQDHESSISEDSWDIFEDFLSPEPDSILSNGTEFVFPSVADNNTKVNVNRSIPGSSERKTIQIIGVQICRESRCLNEGTGDYLRWKRRKDISVTFF